MPNGYVTGWDYTNEKFDMKVPERILVIGQDQHIGINTIIISSLYIVNIYYKVYIFLNLYCLTLFPHLLPYS